MASHLLFKGSVVSLHVLTLLLGALAIEFILYLRRYNEDGNFLSEFTSSSFVSTIRQGGFKSFTPYLLTSWRRCFCCIGFVANLSVLYFANVADCREFLESFWRFDAVVSTLLLFFVIPLGLSNKFVNLRSNPRRSRRCWARSPSWASGSPSAWSWATWCCTRCSTS